MAISNAKPGAPVPSGAEQSRKSASNFLQETLDELKKTTWPTKQESWRLTGVVIAVIIVLGFYMGVLDFVLTSIVNKLSLLK